MCMATWKRRHSTSKHSYDLHHLSKYSQSLTPLITPHTTLSLSIHIIVFQNIILSLHKNHLTLYSLFPFNIYSIIPPFFLENTSKDQPTNQIKKYQQFHFLLFHSNLLTTPQQQTLDMSEKEMPLLKRNSQLEWKSSLKQVLLSKYNPFQYPANLKQAQNHGRAKRICTPDIDLDSQRCQCCMLPIQNKLIPLNCNLQQLVHLGIAYPLYFLFLKAGVFLMVIHFLMIGIAEMVLNLTGSQCQELKINTRICRLSFINSLSFSKLTVSEVQNILNITFVLFAIVIIEIIKFRCNLFNLRLQKNVKSPADYSILIKGLPQDITVHQIEEFMGEQLRRLSLDPTVVKIYLVYDVKQYLALYTKKRQIYEYRCSLTEKYNSMMQKSNSIDDMTKRKQCLQKAEIIFQEITQTDATFDTIEDQIQKYQQSLKITIQNIQKQEIMNQMQAPKQLKFSGKCIITLNSCLAAQTLVKHYQLTFKQSIIYRIQEVLSLDSAYDKKYKGHIIKLEKAPDASDVIFANLGFHSIRRLKHRLLVTLIVAGMITLSCLILTFGKKIFNQSKVNSKLPLKYSFLASLLVAFFNSVLGRLVRYFSLDEYYVTQSSYYYSVAARVTVVYIVNMLLTTVISNIATFYIVATPAPPTYPGIELNFLGLMNDFFFVNATNSLIAIIFVFFDYRTAYRAIKRWYISSFKQVTQAEANLAFQNQPIDMAYKYSHGYRLLLFTAAVGPFIPNAILISIGVGLLIYVIDKYLFLRRWMCPYKLGYALSSQMLRILNMYPLFVSFSNWMIMCIPMVSSSAPSQTHFYLSLGVFLCTLFVQFSPTGIISKTLTQMFNKDDNKCDFRSYKEMQHQFSQDYSHYYPYFRVSKVLSSDQSSGSSSPTRKNKLLDETNKKLSQSVFGLLRDYIDHKRFTPKT